MGTTVLSLGIVWLALIRWNHPSAMLFLAGAICYFVGTFLVTMFGNVPLNDQLAAVSAADPAASDVWNGFANRFI